MAILSYTIPDVLKLAISAIAGLLEKMHYCTLITQLLNLQCNYRPLIAYHICKICISFKLWEDVIKEGLGISTRIET